MSRTKMSFDNHISIAGIRIPVGSLLRLISPITMKPVMGIGWVVVAKHGYTKLTLKSYPTGASTEHSSLPHLMRLIAQGRMIISEEVIKKEKQK